MLFSAFACVGSVATSLFILCSYYTTEAPSEPARAAWHTGISRAALAYLIDRIEACLPAETNPENNQAYVHVFCVVFFKSGHNYDEQAYL